MLHNPPYHPVLDLLHLDAQRVLAAQVFGPRAGGASLFTARLNDLLDVDVSGAATGDFLQLQSGVWVDFDLLDTANTWGANQLLATTIQLQFGDSNQRILGTTATKTLDIISDGTAGTINLTATNATGVVNIDARTQNFKTASTTQLAITTAAATITSAFPLRFGTSNQRIFGTSPQLDIVADAASSVLNITSSGATTGEVNVQATTNMSIRIAGTDEYFLFDRQQPSVDYESRLTFRAFTDEFVTMDDAAYVQGGFQSLTTKGVLHIGLFGYGFTGHCFTFVSSGTSVQSGILYFANSGEPQASFSYIGTGASIGAPLWVNGFSEIQLRIGAANRVSIQSTIMELGNAAVKSFVNYGTSALLTIGFASATASTITLSNSIGNLTLNLSGSTTNVGKTSGSIGFFGVTAAARAGTTAEIKAALVTYGLLQTGTADLNIGSGKLTCGIARIGGAIQDNNGNTIVDLTETTTAVNYVNITNAAAGGNVTIASTGSDAAVNLLLDARRTSGTASAQLQVGGTTIFSAQNDGTTQHGRFGSGATRLYFDNTFDVIDDSSDAAFWRFSSRASTGARMSLLGTAGNYDGSTYRYFQAGGIISTNFASSNLPDNDATLSDIRTYSIPARLLGDDGDSVEFEFLVTLSGSATPSKQVALLFNTTTVYDSGAVTAITSGTMVVRGRVVRLTSATARVWVTVVTDVTAFASADTAKSADVASLNLDTTAYSIALQGRSDGVGETLTDVQVHASTMWWWSNKS